MYYVVRKISRLEKRIICPNVKTKTFFKKNQKYLIHILIFFFFTNSKKGCVCPYFDYGKRVCFSIFSHVPPPHHHHHHHHPSHPPRLSLLLTPPNPPLTPSLNLPAHSRPSPASPLRPCTPPPHSNRIIKIPFDSESVKEVGFEPRDGRWRGGAGVWQGDVGVGRGGGDPG